MARCVRLLLQSSGLISRNVSACGSRVLYRPFSEESTTFTNNTRLKKTDYWEEYERTKQAVEDEPVPVPRDPTAVYANNELDLNVIDVYGFDYDYTLASYKQSLHYLIYQLGRDALVRDQKYPEEIGSFKYDPSFAIRGLHCDISKGVLLKIDAFHHIQMGSVYRGLQPVPDDEVMAIYNGTHVAIDNMSSFHGTASYKKAFGSVVESTQGSRMHQLMDLFALPEMTLYSNVIEYFRQNNIQYDPEYVFYDVRNTVQGLHSSGYLHQEILRNLKTYLDSDTHVGQLLKTLQAANKKLFLITNSGINFVDLGMRHIIGPDWADLFDVVITNARKPKFFYDCTRPFRSYDVRRGIKSWDRVTSLKKGKVYQEGNLYQFRELTGWYGSRVLYFGDHVYSDLADAALKHGWRTGAIIPELEHEINALNNPDFVSAVRWLVALESLIERMQASADSPESEAIIADWLAERDKLRVYTKRSHNKQFGSVFRTFHNPTYFSRRLNRFADVYMSNVINLLGYPLSYTFYPRRAALPHEYQIPTHCQYH